MTGAQIIVLATPVFLLLIAVEYLVGVKRGRNTYRLNDALNSIGLGIMSQLTGVFSKLLVVGIYSAAFAHVALWQLPSDRVWVWVAGLLVYDLCYYWHHRLGHTVALFYLPMAVLGFPPLVLGSVALIDLLYQYWVHTQHIGKLGWFDRWFCAPSNHRVHHAVNSKYLNRNYGGILIVWDRLFGSFQEEDEREPCVYGTRGPLRSWNPLWANLQYYAKLASDSWRARAWFDKVRVWFERPGWRPADVAQKWPNPVFDLANVQRYDPPMSRSGAWVAAALFLLLLGATAMFLWRAHALAIGEQLAGAAGIVLGLWVVGVVTSPAGGGSPQAARS